MRAISRLFCLRQLVLVAVLLLATILPLSPAPGRNVLSVRPPAEVTATRGKTFDVSVRAEIQRGYHVNSHEPTDEYIIPLKLTWTADPMEVVKVTYPKPELESYSFSESPLSVFTGDFDIKTQFQVPVQASGGNHTVTGRLRYQACTDKLCLPPKNVSVTVNVTIE